MKRIIVMIRDEDQRVTRVDALKGTYSDSEAQRVATAVTNELKIGGHAGEYSTAVVIDGGFTD